MKKTTNAIKHDKYPATGPVLIVATDTVSRRTLRTALTRRGFDVGEANRGSDVLMKMRMIDYDLVLLDCDALEMSAIQICRSLRSMYARLPILALSRRKDAGQEIRVLEAGADDYIANPFNPRVLAARMRSNIRRYHAPEVPVQKPLIVGEITLDSVRREVEKNGTVIHLSRQEFDMLQLLMEHAGKPLTYGTIFNSIWGQNSSESRQKLRVLINSLRKKLEADAANPKHILNDMHLGYRFADR